MNKVAMIVWNEFLNDARVLKEAQTLQHSGYRVRVFALHTPGVTKEIETLEDGVEVQRIARSPMWRWRKKGTVSTNGAPTPPGNHHKLSLKILILRAIARIWTHCGLMLAMLRYRPAVIHAHDVNTLPTAFLASKLARSLLVYDAHEISTSREGYSSLRNMVGKIEKVLMPRAHGTITTTTARAKFFARAYSIDRPVVLQNRPRLTISKRTNKIRDELSLNKSWPIVLYQGGLQQGRGLEKLVKTALQVPNCYFVFIGGGRLTAQLKELRDERDLQERVHFIPTLSLTDLPAYTASADIGVQPIENTCLNHYTTDSNKLFEYIIAGLPVIATDFPEIRKIVRDGEIGLLVPPGSEDELAKAINMLAGDTELRKHYSKKAIESASALNWEAQENLLSEMYSRIIKENSCKAS
ncbi:glycosyltransferase family 4 protein [Pseudomonas shirazica]|uniref:glycosyltransferase family 4 protein n=1 Tax=Pseudomonas shirazica TaxID=1940636 RepID=UPI001EE0162A|nr:glycosyltransferase family 4 protein [Pseudomonas shirazica]